jgi:cysteine-rich repeat protein
MRSALVAALALACNAPASPIDDTTTAAGSSSSGDDETTGAPNASSGPDSSSSSEATGEAASDSGTSSTGDDSTSSTSTAVSSSDPSTSTGPASFCGDGIVDWEGGETCDDGQETKLCDDDCTVVACGDAHLNEAAGEECDDGNVNEADGCLSGCKLPGCGNGILEVGEECDDGNFNEEDGCDAVCLQEKWTHYGVVTGVAEADLYLWEECWSGVYLGLEPVQSVLDACQGDHILVGCKKVGVGVLTVAAHAPRADVFSVPEPNFNEGEYHAANGVDWYWSPSYGRAGFSKIGEGWCSDGNPTADGMCLGTKDGLFDAWGYCGTKQLVMFADATSWERVVFQAWD